MRIIKKIRVMQIIPEIIDPSPYKFSSYLTQKHINLIQVEPNIH